MKYYIDLMGYLHKEDGYIYYWSDSKYCWRPDAENMEKHLNGTFGKLIPISEEDAFIRIMES